jgi:uncharacterized protein involved in outer membrane biogenesis
MKFAGTRARRAAVITAAVLAVLVAVVAFFPWNALRGVVASAVSARLHRTVTIEHLAVDLGWTTRVRIDGVTVANAEWSQTQPMATLPTTLLTFSIPSLFRLSPDAVHAVKPQVLLERSGSGEANWKFGEDGKSGAFVGAIDFEDGRVRYVDPTLRADINLSITGANSGQVAHLLQFKGGGTLRGESFSIDGTSAGLSELRKIDDPYRLTFDARAGRTTIAFDGTVVPSDLQDVKGALHLKGADLSQLYPIVPTPLPWTPPYDLAGDLTHANARWIFRGIKGTVGNSDLSGDFTVDVSTQRPLTVAELASRKFDYKDLGGFIGLPPANSSDAVKTADQQKAASKRAATERVLPDKPFELAKLRDHDVDLKFKGQSVKWGSVPIDNLDTHLTLKQGIMRFKPLDFGLAGGHVISNVTLDVTRELPSAEATIEVRNLELKRIFPQLASPNGSAGRFGGRARFQTRGNSVAKLFAAADGEAAIALRGGLASTLLLVLTNLDLARAAQLLIGGDETAAIHCVVSAWHAKNGVMTPDLLVIDTSAELITGTGSIDFATEKYDLHLKADSKKPSLLALKGPIVIGGTFKTPAIHPEVAPVVARVGAAIGLGVVAPTLAMLPLIDLGDAPDADCRALYQDARVQTGTNERIARPGNDASKPVKGPTAKADATATERNADAKSRATVPAEAARAPAPREGTETRRPNVRDPKDEPAA